MGVFDSGMSLTQRLDESGVSKNQEFVKKQIKWIFLGVGRKQKIQEWQAFFIVLY
jgi:hypothetical protein